MNDDEFPTNDEIDALKKVTEFLNRIGREKITITPIGTVRLTDSDGAEEILTPIRLDMIRFGH